MLQLHKKPLLSKNETTEEYLRTWENACCHRKKKTVYKMTCFNTMKFLHLFTNLVNLQINHPLMLGTVLSPKTKPSTSKQGLVAALLHFYPIRGWEASNKAANTWARI